jgi:hypothetical protein
MRGKSVELKEVPGPRTTIADRIRWMMRALRLTQQALAEAASMAPSQLSVLLKRLDARPFAIELETVGRIAQAGGVVPMWLLHGEGDPFHRDEREAEVAYPPLRRRADWQTCVATLRAAGLLPDDRLVDWVGDVAMPLTRADRLTPSIVMSLARIRQELDFGGGYAALREVEARAPVARRKPAGATRTRKAARRSPGK